MRSTNVVARPCAIGLGLSHQRDRDRCHPLAHAHDVETTGRKPHFVAVGIRGSPDDERTEHKTPILHAWSIPRLRRRRRKVTTNRPIRRALVSVFHKEGIEVLAQGIH